MSLSLSCGDWCLDSDVPELVAPSDANGAGCACSPDCKEMVLLSVIGADGAGLEGSPEAMVGWRSNGR